MKFKEERKMFLPCDMGETEVCVYTDKDGKEFAFLTFEGAFCGKPKKRVAKKNGWKYSRAPPPSLPQKKPLSLSAKSKPLISRRPWTNF